MRKPYASVLLLAVVASLSVACGSNDSSDNSQAASAQTPPSTPAVSAAPSAPATTSDPATTSSPASTSSTASFCEHIAPGGKGPANAFMEIPIWDSSTARSAALEEQKLMKGAVPPKEIARDWKTWNTYVSAVVRATNAGGSLDSVTGLEKKSRGAQERLTKYAFAHCS